MDGKVQNSLFCFIFLGSLAVAAKQSCWFKIWWKIHCQESNDLQICNFTFFPLSHCSITKWRALKFKAEKVLFRGTPLVSLPIWNLMENSLSGIKFSKRLLFLFPSYLSHWNVILIDSDVWNWPFTEALVIILTLLWCWIQNSRLGRAWHVKRVGAPPSLLIYYKLQ